MLSWGSTSDDDLALVEKSEKLSKNPSNQTHAVHFWILEIVFLSNKIIFILPTSVLSVLHDQEHTIHIKSFDAIAHLAKNAHVML